MEVLNLKDKKLSWYYQNTSINDEIHYAVSVIDQDKFQYYYGILDEVDFIVFKNIMKSNKYAILFCKHPSLGEAATIKLIYIKRIKNCINYNNVRFEELIDEYNKLDI